MPDESVHYCSDVRDKLVFFSEFESCLRFQLVGDVIKVIVESRCSEGLSAVSWTDAQDGKQWQQLRTRFSSLFESECQ